MANVTSRMGSVGYRLKSPFSGEALYFEWNSDEALGDAKLVEANTSVLYFVKGGHVAKEVEEIFPAPWCRATFLTFP